MDSELLNMLENQLGEINCWKEECPGVYYLSILPESEDTLFCTEYYLVLNDAPISKEARNTVHHWKTVWFLSSHLKRTAAAQRLLNMRYTDTE